ncbi:MAG TPA: thiamine pyrophosphate-binding protein [Thermohalobaculum sp.]|nr:thiamine pyrophosphate-binding protein [Thermohalobaculum sp.]
MRGADLLAGTLRKAGVGRIFSLSGNQIMPVYDACLEAGIAIVHTRDEGAAVFMADAWGQLTGEVGVALVTAGPGAMNAVGPLFTARASESPVLLLAGDSPRARDGQGAFQELAQTAVTAPLTKLSFRAGAAAGLGEDVARALRAALSGRPGPVHLALPADVLEDDAGDAALPSDRAVGADVRAAEPGEVAAIADAIRTAEAPLIVTGPALSATRAGPLLDQLSEAADAPVVPLESPRGLRDPALGGLEHVLARADLIVSLGKTVDFGLGFGAPGVSDAACRWIVVDAERGERDRAHRNLGSRLAFTLDADPRAVAEALIGQGEGGDGNGPWRAEVARRLAARVRAGAGQGGITPAEVTAAVQRRLDAAPASVVVCDGGEFGPWAQACVSGTERIVNGPSGAIGAGPCYAFAAGLARPDALVVCLVGDGTAGFHLPEFETAAREGVPFVMVVGNDQRWNAEHQIQLRAFGPDRLIGCELSDARYDLAVTALGGHGEHVTKAGDLDGALERAIASGKPACVNVALEGQAAPGAPADH